MRARPLDQEIRMEEERETDRALASYEPPAVEVRGLSHHYGAHPALVDVNLEVPAGSLYALLGPNGAGKTTLLKILLGLLRPSGGEVRLRGQRVDQVGPGERRELTYVAEGQELPEWMTLRQLEGWLAPLYPGWDRGLADELRDRFRLPLDRRIRRMSRGEKMKVSLLVALAPRPRLLVLDEPFTGMDALVKDELVSGLLEIAGQDEWTVLLCSHDIGELELLADWVGFLDRGRLILSEPLEVLRGRFRQVEAGLRPGSLTELSGLPPTWLAPRRAGNRLAFLTCDHGVVGWEAQVRAALPGAEEVEVRPASLREVFVALAAEGLGGRDWNVSGGLE